MENKFYKLNSIFKIRLNGQYEITKLRYATNIFSIRYASRLSWQSSRAWLNVAWSRDFRKLIFYVNWLYSEYKRTRRLSIIRITNGTMTGIRI